MKSSMKLSLAAICVLTVTAVMAQNEAPLDFDDLVGVWNLTYENGETGTFTISRSDSGVPEILVKTSFSEGAAHDIVIEGDTIVFHRETVILGRTTLTAYTAKFAEGTLKGIGDIRAPEVDFEDSVPFTANRAE